MSVWSLRIASIVTFVGLSFLWMPTERIKQPITNWIVNPGFEAEVESNQLNQSWELSTQSGDYALQLTKRRTLDDKAPSRENALEYCRESKRFSPGREVHSGEYACEFGGTGGMASLLSNPVNIGGCSLVECDAWIKSEYELGSSSSMELQISGDRAPNSILGSTQADPSVHDWQKLTLFMEIDDLALNAKSFARLAIRLNGEALVRIDDVAMRIFAESTLIKDGGFENFAAGKLPLDWYVVSETGRNTAETNSDDAHQGVNCVRLAGTDGWKVLHSRRIPSESKRVIVLAHVRVKDGEGGVKIEYFGSGAPTAQTYLVGETDGWRRVMLVSKSGMIKSSHSFCVTLVASRRNDATDPYCVDFDDVHVFVAK